MASKEYMPKDNRLLPSEGVEQATLFSWAKMQEHAHPELRLLIHIPNGGKRSKSEAARFKAEGVKAGVSDIFLPVARGDHHGLWIELKRLAGGQLSAAQRAWLEEMREQGYAAACCKGWQQAAEMITAYLESK